MAELSAPLGVVLPTKALSFVPGTALPLQVSVEDQSPGEEMTARSAAARAPLVMAVTTTAYHHRQLARPEKWQQCIAGLRRFLASLDRSIFAKERRSVQRIKTDNSNRNQVAAAPLSPPVRAASIFFCNSPETCPFPLHFGVLGAAQIVAGAEARLHQLASARRTRGKCRSPRRWARPAWRLLALFSGIGGRMSLSFSRSSALIDLALRHLG